MDTGQDSLQSAKFIRHTASMPVFSYIFYETITKEQVRAVKFTRFVDAPPVPYRNAKHGHMQNCTVLAYCAGMRSYVNLVLYNTRTVPD